MGASAGCGEAAQATETLSSCIDVGIAASVSCRDQSLSRKLAAAWISMVVPLGQEGDYGNTPSALGDGGTTVQVTAAG